MRVVSQIGAFDAMPERPKSPSSRLLLGGYNGVVYVERIVRERDKITQFNSLVG